MRVFVRSSSAIRFCLAGMLVLFASAPGWTDTPKRVVSINVCTDQLAMLLADETQLFSVSHLATDPRVSAMSDDAEAYEINYGRAEEVFLMEPDLVVAGAYAARATIEMLQRFGIPVEVFTPVTGVDDVPSKLTQMGAALGREEKAAALIRDFNGQLEALRAEVKAKPDAALYSANGYTTGDQTLAGQILAAAGFSNVAVDAGISSGGLLPLEVLVMSDPDVIVTGQKYPGASRSEAILAHPALTAMTKGVASGSITNRDWVCGTPFVLRAIEALAVVRRELEKSDGD